MGFLAGYVPESDTVQVLSEYHKVSKDPAFVAMASLPLALCYSLGLMWASPHARSGVDLITSTLMGTLGEQGYLWALLGLSFAVIGFAVYQYRATFLRRTLWVFPVVGEATVYGLIMGSGIIWLMQDQHLLGPSLVSSEFFDHMVLAAGAGVHEELLFRLLLIPVLIRVFEVGLVMPKPLAVGGAVVLSSLLFSGAHHLAGEAFEAYAFTYRSLAGLVFAALFLMRGYAVAAWSHAIYDLHVLTSMTQG